MRAVPIAVTAIAAVVVALTLILTGGGSYTVHARFVDASQLVKGNTVEVGGRRVGLVTKIALTGDGQAEVTLDLEDESVKPLHEGTRASVRTIGLSGVANRFVDLKPGPPTTPEIPDGGVLPATATRGIVDLDALLNSLDEDVRGDFQRIVRDLAVAVDDTTARQTNGGLEMLDPAASRLAAMGEQLTRDQAALTALVQRTSSLAGTLAEHRAALGDSLESGAGVFATLAQERETLTRLLQNAPGAMRRTQATLERVRTRTLPVLDPVISKAAPSIGPLADLLRASDPTLEHAGPMIERLRALVPQARRVFAPLPELAAAAAPAVASITKGLESALPMISGLRPYTPELVAGFFSGFGGNSAHAYDANGHYARIYLESSPGSLNGVIPRPPSDQLGGYRLGLDARCPGAASEPHPDGTNPWHVGASCDPEDDK